MSAKAKENDKMSIFQDISTPFGVPLRGIYKRSYGHTVIKDKLPVILTNIIDHLCKDKKSIISLHGENAERDIKQIIGFISQLKTEVVTNKSLRPMRLNNKEVGNDAEEWNKYLEYRTQVEGEVPKWFSTIWLYCECYMYRIVAQEVGLTSTLANYDVFGPIKQHTFFSGINFMKTLAVHVKSICDRREHSEAKQDFLKLLKLSLWANRYCDGSVSAGIPTSSEFDSNSGFSPFDVVESLNENILVNDWESVWNIVNNTIMENDGDIHIVLDNSGYELVADMYLATFLSCLAPKSKITFHVKKYPWYVSDVTPYDFTWTIDQMRRVDVSEDLSENTNSENRTILQHLVAMFNRLLSSGNWSVKADNYWTGPYDFKEMKEKEKDLYAQLSNATLVIFKGDLNYRKLLGDINFEYTTSFKDALGDFQPTNILSLRTVKSDVCVGLSQGVAESLFEKDEHWMRTGQYGLIQAIVIK
ncbi:protein-glutamate O-methyltransferase-like isoform X2 [Pseudomyrmex gracilis]|nr:protein-glutamate O-methyltransferase-like isoform X2 [Pseudomyrmex gracilis]